ncbi:MAG: hypothetical protein ACIAQF_06225 [Phycisphaerales bacterium JB065]
MHDFRITERLRRLFGADPALEGAGDVPLGEAILALARQAAEMHREAESALWERSGDGHWPDAGLLTVAEYAELHGIDLDAFDDEPSSGGARP